MARIKVNSEEKLDDANIQKVIKLLNPTEEGKKPITKKEACAVLNISYNTSRLDKIISTFLEREQLKAKRRAEKRGKPATQDEVVSIITDYLKGTSIAEVAASNYRSTGFVNRILEVHSVPRRPASRNYFSPELIPEGAACGRFTIGESVYSARYDSLATVRREFPPKTPGNPHDFWIYAIYLEDEFWQEQAYQPAYELASLAHLVNLGVKL